MLVNKSAVKLARSEYVTMYRIVVQLLATSYFSSRKARFSKYMSEAVIAPGRRGGGSEVRLGCAYMPIQDGGASHDGFWVLASATFPLLKNTNLLLRPFSYVRFSYSRFQGLDFEQEHLDFVVKDL